MDIKKDCNNVKRQLSDAFSLWGEAIEKYQTAINSIKGKFEKVSADLDSIESRCDASIQKDCSDFVDKMLLKMQKIYNEIDNDRNSDITEKRFSRLLGEVDQFIKTLNKE